MPKALKKIELTFLEYLVERLMGPPAYGSTWHCPFHGDSNPSFRVLPHKPQYKDRWICFGCGERGDEFDFLKLYFPGEDYSARLDRMAALREEYQQLMQPDRVALLHRGPGSTAGEMLLRLLYRQGRIDHCDLLEVVAELNHRRSLVTEWKRLGCKTPVGGKVKVKS